MNDHWNLFSSMEGCHWARKVRKLNNTTIVSFMEPDIRAIHVHHSDLKWRSVVLKLRSSLCSTRSTVVVFDGATKCFEEIESSYFCHDETRVQVLNTAQFAEVYFIFKFLKNLVTLAFCTLFEILEERFRSGLPKTWHQL